MQSDGQPGQIVASSVTFTLPVVDLSQVPATDREAEARRLAMEEPSGASTLPRGL